MMKYLMSKVTEDLATSGYGQVCQHVQLYSLDLDDANAISKFFYGLDHGIDALALRFVKAWWYQEFDETESQFLLRTSLEGIYPDYEAHWKRNRNWTIELLEIVDYCTKEVLYSSNNALQKTDLH